MIATSIDLEGVVLVLVILALLILIIGRGRI